MIETAAAASRGWRRPKASGTATLTKRAASASGIAASTGQSPAAPSGICSTSKPISMKRSVLMISSIIDQNSLIRRRQGAASSPAARNCVSMRPETTTAIGPDSSIQTAMR